MAVLVAAALQIRDREAASPEGNPVAARELRSEAPARTPRETLVRQVQGDTGRPVIAEAAHEDAALVDGTVAQEWGSFVRAREIRYDCRDEREVWRPVPKAEDFSRRCDTRTVFDHPYELFTPEQLDQIAGHDPVAAYILGYRILEYRHRHQIESGRMLEDGLSHAITAFVLTGEPQTYDLLIDGRHFPNRSVWSTVGGVPDEREVREKGEQYRWLKAGRNLGVIEEDDYRWVLVTREMERYETYFDREALDAGAERLAERLAARRAIETGEQP